MLIVKKNKTLLLCSRVLIFIFALLLVAGGRVYADFALPGVPLPDLLLPDDSAATSPGDVESSVYRDVYSPVLPPRAGMNNYFLNEETYSTGYHYVVSAPPGAYKAEGFMRLPSSFLVNAHRRFPNLMNNDVPYFFFGIYTAKGGIDVGLCWQKTPDYPDGVWLTFCTVFPKSGAFYTHRNGSAVEGLEAGQVLYMAATQLDDGVRLEVSALDQDGSLYLISETDFDIPDLALRADGRGTFFNREISLAQHELDYTNGAQMISASWWDAKLSWTNYSTAWDYGAVSLMRTRWEPVSEKRVVLFEQHPYDGETVSFIYEDSNRPPAGE